MTKRRQRRIDRRAYEAYKSRSSLPPVELPERGFTAADWVGLVLVSLSVSAALAVAIFEHLERGL